MIICEFDFLKEDPHNPGYSMSEVDFYATSHKTTHNHVPNHALRLRKNLTNGSFELFRKYVRDIWFGDNASLQARLDVIQGSDEIILSSKDLFEIIRRANSEVKKYAPFGAGEPDKVCKHKGKQKASDCPGLPVHGAPGEDVHGATN